MNAPTGPSFYADNRARFLDRLGPQDAALLFGAPHRTRNADTEHRYRQESDVLFLSGWAMPEVALLFRPQSPQPFIMFVQPRDPKVEVWSGRRPGPEGALSRYGADAAYPFSELAARLPGLLQGYRSLHYPFAVDADHDRLVMGAIVKARREARESGLDVPDAFIHPARLLHELRLRKSPAELDLLRRAAAITRDGHLAAMQATATGVPEYVLEAALEGTFRRLGGDGPGYPSIVGGGANATILHYVDNCDPLHDGELVCVDAGCEYRGYTADVTRTWPVSGRFTGPQRDLYQIVLQAQQAAIAAAQVGGLFQDIHHTATRVLTEGMVSLGLLQGDVDELIEQGKQKKYYMHGTSHWLGLDVHDVGAYASCGQSRILEPGMVLTVEPGLYIAEDDEDAPEHLRGIGIRIEDDVLVTDRGPEILTIDIPKQIDDVEAAVRSGRR